MIYYFDTCIWIDFLNERNGIVSKRVLEIILNCQVIISEKVIMELDKYIKFVDLLKFKNINLVETFELQRNKALQIARDRNIPFGDVLHAILANDNDAILLTRDKHFLKLKDVARIELL